MSTTTTNPPPAPAASGLYPPAGPRSPREIKLVSHSPIFYWWPIWALGFVLALITLVENHRLAVIPADAELRYDTTAAPKDSTQYVLTVPGDAKHQTKSLDRAIEATGKKEQPTFRTRVSEKAWMGPLFCVVLILTIVITNVPLRGLWSFLVLLLFVVLALVFSVFNVWEDLLSAFGNLHIYINMAGYLFFAVTVLVLWIVSVFIFDQRTYMIVTPGQIQVCEHIGASVRNFPAESVNFEKQRDDLFRHWILGFFSGDLIIHVANKEEIRLPNVLWIGWRLEEVQQVLREKATVIHS
ncbi:MAG: hypothetical protein K2X82_14300 [Gemmataceae bacterium]|nr:hypothetical protein [Gemmataceae bacterium]